MTIPAAAVTAAAEAFFGSTDPLAYNRVEAGLKAAAPALRLQSMEATAHALSAVGFTEAAALVRAGAATVVAGLEL